MDFFFIIQFVFQCFWKVYKEYWAMIWFRIIRLCIWVLRGSTCVYNALLITFRNDLSKKWKHGIPNHFVLRGPPNIVCSKYLFESVWWLCLILAACRILCYSLRTWQHTVYRQSLGVVTPESSRCWSTSNTALGTVAENQSINSDTGKSDVLYTLEFVLKHNRTSLKRPLQRPVVVETRCLINTDWVLLKLGCLISQVVVNTSSCSFS